MSGSLGASSNFHTHLKPENFNLLSASIPFPCVGFCPQSIRAGRENMTSHCSAISVLWWHSVARIKDRNTRMALCCKPWSAHRVFWLSSGCLGLPHVLNLVHHKVSRTKHFLTARHLKLCWKSCMPRAPSRDLVHRAVLVAYLRLRPWTQSVYCLKSLATCAITTAYLQCPLPLPIAQKGIYRVVLCKCYTCNCNI